VYTVFAFCDDVLDFLETVRPSVACFKRAPRLKPGNLYGKNYGVEEGLVSWIERAIDEDVKSIISWKAWHGPWQEFI
jgi:hypothetical protein